MRIVSIVILLLTLTSSSICERYKADVESVYDGDTVTLDIKVGFDIVIDDAKIRLYGIDAPEMRGEERPQGLVARDALRELIDQKEIEIEYHGKGKYFRYVATLFLDTINVNHWMVRNGYAEFKEY
jgi:micrococcal nuclease